jgi:hypothetical protein
VPDIETCADVGTDMPLWCEPLFPCLMFRVIPFRIDSSFLRKCGFGSRIEPQAFLESEMIKEI